MVFNHWQFDTELDLRVIGVCSVADGEGPLISMKLEPVSFTQALNLFFQVGVVLDEVFLVDHLERLSNIIDLLELSIFPENKEGLHAFLLSVILKVHAVSNQ